jgi:alpha-glucosidase
MLALPGSSYLYQGEELGLEEVDVPAEHRQDPAWLRGGRQGRDGCRVPLPWSGSEPPFGFGPAGSAPWIPQPPDWSSLTVEAQSGVPGSTLEFYRSALAARRRLATPEGEEIRLAHRDDDVFGFERGSLRVLVNCGEVPVPLPRGQVLLASGPVSDDLLPPDTAVWMR